MSKKRFKDTAVGKVLIGAAGLVSPPLGKVLEGVLTPGQALAEIKSSDISPEDKAKLEQLYIQQQITEDQEITKRWQSDNDAGMLTRFIRPTLLVYLVGITSLLIFIDSAGMYDFVVKEQWVDLLTTVTTTAVFAYFGSKGVEKTFRK